MTLSDKKVLLIVAQWHSDITDQFLHTFTKRHPNTEVLKAPGSLEIPLQAQRAAKTGKYDAIVVNGLVVDGGIYRHEFVAQSVLDNCMKVQMETEIPVIYAVLTPKDFQETQTHIDFFKSHFVKKAEEAYEAFIMTYNNQEKTTV